MTNSTFNTSIILPFLTFFWGVTTLDQAVIIYYHIISISPNHESTSEMFFFKHNSNVFPLAKIHCFSLRIEGKILSSSCKAPTNLYVHFLSDPLTQDSPPRSLLPSHPCLTGISHKSQVCSYDHIFVFFIFLL